MKIQDLYQKTIKYAGEKHAFQFIPDSSVSYIVHLANVAMEVMRSYEESPEFDLHFAIQLALLHDVLEDTDTDFEELSQEFGTDIAIGVLALTKDESFASKEDKMMDSLQRIRSKRKEVGLVKLADRIVNLQEPPASWDTDKVAEYRKEAVVILHYLKSTNEYLAARLKAKIQEYTY